MLKKKIKIPIYFGDLILIQSDDFEGLSEKYELKDLPAFDAVVFPKHLKNGYTVYYLIVKEEVHPKIIAHEVVHIVNNIYHDRGIDLDVLNDEPQAYLTGWVTEQCYKYLKIKI